ncbi:MAG TPA: low specificity L-threonine aldolase [Xanthobacteraceae bacterium]|nr:low specificity L-threonine aldolase [Xanthobacteraceae bacterium]
MNFASDNAAGIAPAILDAMVRASQGFALGYGNDAWTRSVERLFCNLFEREVAAFLVTTGTAANALALAHLSAPWGAVLCHAESHIATDEAGAPEFFGGGLKLIALPGEGGKLTPEVTAAAIKRGRGAPHAVLPSVLSLTQATEAGTVYRLEEVRALAELAHAHGLAVHMDGARFGNALVTLGCSPAEATWKAGVDVLSFGATKAGALAAEAVIFFDPEQARGMDSRRKRGGHLLSKHRFLAAQFEAFLTDGLWLKLAAHANSAASTLAQDLTQAGLPPCWPVEANEIFVVLPPDVDDRLRAAGAQYYAWPREALPQAVIPPGHRPVRLVTSFATTQDEVERFLAIVRSAL